MTLSTRAVVVLAIFVSVGAAVVAAAKLQERKTRIVTRVKRPTFTERDWDGVYFQDLFEEGLVGPRPQQASPNTTPPSVTPPSGAGETGGEPGTFAWSKTISRSTLENEIKRLQRQLAVDITTPAKFKTGYRKVRQSFEMLSMLFALIREYDGEVRWKRFAGAAQASFERGAGNAHVGSIQAYESCRRRKQDLEELVRGGNFAGTDEAPEELEWENVVGRIPIMKRLDLSEGRIKEYSSNQGAFEKESDALLHEAEMIAAMGRVMTQENMDDADDDDYVKLSMAMVKAANEVAQACRNKNYDGASTGVNRIMQSCDDCHADWR